MPARTTSIGCNVIGTGVHGRGIAICDAAATAAAKPKTPMTVVRDGRSARVALVMPVDGWTGGRSDRNGRLRLVRSSNTQGDGVAPTQTKCGQTAPESTVF